MNVSNNEIYALLKHAHWRFCKARIEMGVLLEHIKTSDGWKGRGESFADFLEQERIKPSAAYQYMRVARKLFYEMGMTDAEFDEIASCNMGVLDLACQVINERNRDEVLSVISALSERDARQRLLELSDEAAPKPAESQRSRRVQQLVRQFRDLPDDQRIEFTNEIRLRGSSQRLRS